MAQRFIQLLYVLVENLISLNSPSVIPLFCCSENHLHGHLLHFPVYEKGFKFHCLDYLHVCVALEDRYEKVFTLWHSHMTDLRFQI